MTTSEFVVLVWILLIFGGISAFFTNVAANLILARLRDMGFFIRRAD